MKLIDLLVQELPKHGGWPEGAVECERFIDEATIDFYDWCGNWPVDCGEKYGAIAVKCIKPREAGDGYRKENVKKEEYEAALAASKQPEWNGEGLPPVGCECEREVPRGWSRCKINYNSGSIIVYQMLDSGNEDASTPCAFRFRPIRTEAERKREEAIAAMRNFATNFNHTAVIHAIEQVYESIAAGKIPHITLK